MAIHSIPLLAAEKPPPMTSGIELFFAEAHNVFPGSDGEADPEDLVFKALTVLISFSVDDADRAALWPIRTFAPGSPRTAWRCRPSS